MARLARAEVFNPKEVYEMRSLISKRRFYLKRFKPEPAATA